MITVEGLTKKFGGFSAVDDVSFVCQPGRVTGFLGPNGAGKTTTMRVMVGLTPATHGRTTTSRTPACTWGCSSTRRRSTPAAPVARS
jgi:ABC-type multidrug transport system ATPase subunit